MGIFPHFLGAVFIVSPDCICYNEVKRFSW